MSVAVVSAVSFLLPLSPFAASADETPTPTPSESPSPTPTPEPAGPATLKIITAVVNDNGGTNIESNFIITVSGANPSLSSFPGSAIERVITLDPNAAYIVATNPGSSYKALLSPDCTGSIAADDTVTCTIIYDDIDEGDPNAPSPNLVKNPGLETAGSDPSLPLGWSKGTQWGVNAPLYEYPVAGGPESDISNGNAIRVSFPSYQGVYSDPTGLNEGGDAKWYFDPVAVTSGRQYTFSDAYVASVPTIITAEFFDAGGNHLSYMGFYNIPATPTTTWKSITETFIVPDGAASMTVYHILYSAGTLTLDNFSLIQVKPPVPFANGFVSLTFDDGYADHATIAQPILDAAGVKGTFYIISHASGFGVANPGLETVDPENSSMPKDWLTSGSANATFSYLSSGGHSGRAVQVHSNQSNTNSNSPGWYFSPVTILPDKFYSYSDWYKSSTQSAIFVQITVASGSLEYIDSDGNATSDKKPYATLGSSGDEWTQYSTSNIYIPPDAKLVTVIHGLRGAGTLTVDDVAFGAFSIFMTPEQVAGLEADGHEVGGHTQTHPDLATLGGTDATLEISGNRQELLGGGLAPVLPIAYPYGSYNHSVEEISAGAGYTSGRTVSPGFNDKNVDMFALYGQSVNADTTPDQVKNWINQAVADRTWLILVFHQIEEGVSTSEDMAYGATPEMLRTILDYIRSVNIPVYTVSEGVEKMKDPSLNVTVNVENNFGGTMVPSDLTISVDGVVANPQSFVGSSEGTLVSISSNQQYAVNITTPVPSNYAASRSAECVGALSTGHSAACIITLRDKDVTAPAVSIDPIASPTDAAPHLAFSVSDASPTTTECKIDSISFAVCASPFEPVLTASGSHIFTLKATDAAGNIGVASAQFETVIPATLHVLAQQTASATSDSITITWTTTHPATSRVVWDTVSHEPVGANTCNPTAVASASFECYGYANTTGEDSQLVVSHSVTISGLAAATSYYFRPVSHGSPETYGNEIEASTSPTPTPTPTPQPLSSGGGGGCGGCGAITPVVSPTPTPSPTVLGITTGDSANLGKYGLNEGQMISAAGSNDPDIYIINTYGYKRLFLNPVIFNFYGHLGGWSNVKTITPEARDAFPTTTLFQNCETNDPKVYAVEVTGEDTAILHWVNMAGDQAVAQDPEFFKKVFCVNNNEFAWYTLSSNAYTSLSQVPPYKRQ